MENYEEKQTQLFLEKWIDIKIPTSTTILGQEYKIFYVPEDADIFEDGSFCGLCDDETKKIYISQEFLEDKNLESGYRCMQRVLRHEMLHAYMSESGLKDECSFAKNETNIDWMASQWPKITKEMMRIGSLDKEGA